MQLNRAELVQPWVASLSVGGGGGRGAFPLFDRAKIAAYAKKRTRPNFRAAKKRKTNKAPRE